MLFRTLPLLIAISRKKMLETSTNIQHKCSKKFTLNSQQQQQQQQQQKQINDTD